MKYFHQKNWANFIVYTVIITKYYTFHKEPFHYAIGIRNNSIQRPNKLKKCVVLFDSPIIFVSQTCTIIDKGEQILHNPKACQLNWKNLFMSHKL